MAKTDLLPIINSFWRVPVIVGMTGILSTISVICSLFDGTGRLQHACASFWGKFIFWVSRVTVDVEGLEKVPQGRGYLFTANHLSMFDHWGFLAYIPFQFRFAAKSSLFKIPFLGWHLRRSGNLPIYYHNPRQTLESYKNFAERIRSGISFVIYPEGERTFDGITVEFKRGAFLLARHAAAPIVPVTLIGAHLRLKRGSVVIKPGHMRMVFHDPIEHEDYKDRPLADLSDHVRKIILSCYSLES
jgi:1-acyl-sn-glycerol-3-phosphate acyltransferase